MDEDAIVGLGRHRALGTRIPAGLGIDQLILADIHFVGGRRVDVGSGRVARGGAEVWLIRYDPREQEVAVKSGDNKGQTLPERNVVRDLVRLGAWRGKPVAFRLPAASEDGLKAVVLVQAGRGGRVIGAAEPKT